MVPEWLYTLGGMTLCVLLIPYVLGPFLVFFRFRFRMPPTVVSVDPRVHPLPADARNFLAEAFRGLTAEGFELVGTIILPGLVPNVTTLFAMYTNRAACDLALSAIIVAQRDLGRELKKSHVEFVRRYDDGVVVLTNNSSVLSAFKRLPGEFTIKFWQVRDIHQLYVLHQRLTDRYRQRGQPVNRLDAEFGGDAVRYVAQAVLEETFRNQVDTGYLAEDSSGFRPSFKGAWIMAWQELWPIKSIRRWRERRRAEQLLAEFDIRLPVRCDAG